MLEESKQSSNFSDYFNQSHWILDDQNATIRFGQSLAKKLTENNILFIDGPLGAGKTTLVKGIAKGLSINEPITSPTFALSHHYLSGQRGLIHLDLYRLENPLAAYDLFLQEEENAISIGALLIVEWSCRLSDKITKAFHIEIKYMPESGRKIICSSSL